MSDLIIKHLENIQERLSRIEDRLDIQQTPVPNPIYTEPIPEMITPAPLLDTSKAPINVSDVLPDNIAAYPSEPITSPPPITKAPEDMKPTNWLGYAAIVCFVLAAGFIIKLSIDSGWLTPARQVGISALLGGSLIALGLKFIKTDREYASLLPSGGVIILYLTGFAAHRYYELISFETALFVTTLISALCIHLYMKIKHDIYAVTACIGTYLSPIILNMHAESDFSLYYFLVCSLAFATLSVFLKSRLIIVISAYFGIFMTTIIGLDIHRDQLVSVMLMFQFLIFSLSSFFYSKRNDAPLTATEAWSFAPVLLVFYTAEYHFMDRIDPAMAPWTAMGFGVFLLALYIAARKIFPDGLASQGLIVSFVTLVFLHAGYIELLPPTMHPWLLTAIPLILCLIPKRFITPFTENNNSAFFLPIITLGLIIPVEYISLVMHLFETSSDLYIWPALTAVASVWALIAIKYDLIRLRDGFYSGLLAVTHALAVLGFYRLGEHTSSLAVSALWLFYAVAVMLFAAKRKDERMAKSALFVLTFAAGKALLYDASSAPTLIRIFCLLLTGAVLYGCGFLLRKIGNWTESKKA